MEEFLVRLSQFTANSSQPKIRRALVEMPGFEPGSLSGA